MNPAVLHVSVHLCCAVVPCVRLFCAVLYVSDVGVVMAVLGEMQCCYNSCGIYGVKHAFIRLVTSHLLVLFDVLVVICEPAHSRAGAVTDCNCNLL